MTNTTAEDTFVTKITDFVTNSTSEQIIVTEISNYVTIVSICRKIREDERLCLLAG